MIVGKGKSFLMYKQINKNSNLIMESVIQSIPGKNSDKKLSIILQNS